MVTINDQKVRIPPAALAYLTDHPDAPVAELAQAVAVSRRTAEIYRALYRRAAGLERLVCSRCGRTFPGDGKRAIHERACDGSGQTARERVAALRLDCRHCGEHYLTAQDRAVHERGCGAKRHHLAPLPPAKLDPLPPGDETTAPYDALSARIREAIRAAQASGHSDLVCDLRNQLLRVRYARHEALRSASCVPH